MDEVKNNLIRYENGLSEYACKSSEAVRLKEETSDIRPAFFRDVDRIIHALSYTRYLNKTQVYSYKNNDHVSKRSVHVQFVSKIARTIGRSLKLNEDLIEAIALGHDIGHTPLGHEGEKILNEISLLELNESFAHNIQSVRHYMVLENNGVGINLSLQVLDGIMCHNGEMLDNIYKPSTKTLEEFLSDYDISYTNLSLSNKKSPMTLEGCVVRLCDIVGYIGRDIEDAIALGVLNREDLPLEVTSVLGNNNRDIINTLVLDIISNSINKPYIKLSEEVFRALTLLKKFNYANIYNYSNKKEDLALYKEKTFKLFYKYLNDLEENNRDSDIYLVFLHNMSSEYLENTSNKRKVIDYIAGMTDDYYLMRINEV